MLQTNLFLIAISVVFSASDANFETFVQSPSIANQETTESRLSQVQTVEINATKGKQSISYRAVQNLWKLFKDQIQHEPRIIDSVLVVTPNKEAKDSFYASYIDENKQEKILEINKYGVLNLPELSQELAKNTMLNLHSKKKLATISYAPFYVPRVQEGILTFTYYNQLIEQSNQAIRDIPWYGKILYLGRLKAKANGIQFCFGQITSFIEIEGTKTQPDKNGCIIHRVTQDFVDKKSNIFISDGLEFSMILFEE